tara:strand:- start:125 stop:514 length:390 start_codon:yes stop_codon:yes gene_type:complete
MSELCSREDCNAPREMPSAFCEKHLHEWRWEKSELENQISEVEISTGDCSYSYEIIDVIFAFDFASTGFLFGPDASNAFDIVKRKLALKAIDIGGDLVLFTQFSYRNVTSPKNGIEIWAYGTVAKSNDG